MAVRTSLTWIKRRLRAAILELAGRESWPLNSFEFTGTFDENSGRFVLVFGTDLPLDESETYVKILNSLREKFNDFPWFIPSVGLIVRRVENLEEVYQQLMIAEDETDLGELKV